MSKDQRKILNKIDVDVVLWWLFARAWFAASFVAPFWTPWEQVHLGARALLAGAMWVASFWLFSLPDKIRERRMVGRREAARKLARGTLSAEACDPPPPPPSPPSYPKLGPPSHWELQAQAAAEARQASESYYRDKREAKQGRRAGRARTQTPGTGHARSRHSGGNGAPGKSKTRTCPKCGAADPEPCFDLRFRRSKDQHRRKTQHPERRRPAASAAEPVEGRPNQARPGAYLRHSRGDDRGERLIR